MNHDDDTPPQEGEGLLEELFADSVNGADEDGDYHADILLPLEEDRTAVVTKAKDAKGHEHRGKGKGGGQFVSQAEEGAPTDKKDEKTKKDKKTKKESKATPAEKDEKHDRLDAVTEAGEKVKNRNERRKHLYNKFQGSVAKGVREKYGKMLERVDKPVLNAQGKETFPFKIDSFQSGSDSGRKIPSAVTKPKQYVSRSAWEIAKQRAFNDTKVAFHPDVKPTKKDAKEAQAGIKAQAGGNEGEKVNNYRRTLVGNNTDRRTRAIALTDRYGDGKTCCCVYCGLKISYSPQFADYGLEQDKIVSTKEGGKYVAQNLLPGCGPCNEAKGDKSTLKALEDARYGQGLSKQKRA